MAPSTRPSHLAVLQPERAAGARSGSGERAAPDDLAGMLAHDLKTPLAALSMNLDFVEGELPPDAGSELRAALADCRAANASAIRIVTDMADAVRLAAGERRADLEDVDVHALVDDAVRRAAPEAATRGVCMRWVAVPCGLVRADAGLLTRAIDRILERALRHAHADAAIDVALHRATLSVRVRASAGAPGARCDLQAVTRALGIYFADLALRAQGGAVWAERDDDGSLRFVIALPR